MVTHEILLFAITRNSARIEAHAHNGHSSIAKIAIFLVALHVRLSLVP